MSLLEAVILRGTRAAQPAVATVAIGTLYCVTDESNIIERNSGTTWQAYSPSAAGSAITALTSDVTATGPGSVAATIAANAVSDTKLRDSGALSVIGRSANTLGDPADISAVAASGAVLRESGSLLGFGTIATAGIADDAVTYAKIQNVSATDKILGRDTAAAGDIEELSVANGIEFSGAPGIRLTTAERTRQIGITIDGGGSVITTGLKGFKSFPVAGTITGVRLLADQSGSIVIDVWKDTYANFPPTVADTITAAAKPTITTAQKNEDTTLTGWTTAVVAGDVFGFNVDSVTTITRVVLELTIRIDG